MIRLATLGDLIDQNHRLAAYCEASRDGLRCDHGEWLDLEKLAAHLGRNHSWLAGDLCPRLKCAVCGSRQVSIRLHPPTNAPHGAHAYSR